ncbi:MAG: WecB/TagA/CpsF family glycosyltransferase, partial [Clostridia bacterium]|nr:WecB/TagA/CpsF family glycosyltransferase [Clostridia bacterium]
METVNVRGIPFANLTKESAAALVKERLDSRMPTTVFTPNSEIVQDCAENEEFRRAVLSADILLPDGIGVVKAAKMAGTPLREKVAGVEFGEELFRTLPGRSFYILGGKPGVAEDACANIGKKYGVRFAGCRDGYFEKTKDASDAVVEEINSSGADALYVCLGSPYQETWVYENRSAISAPLVIALGGSVDVYAGKVKRAP